MSYKAAVFDMDGTLLDTLEDLGGAMNRVLTARGLPVHPIDSYRFFAGNGAAHLVSCALPEDRRNRDFLDACVQDFVREYQTAGTGKGKPYAGIPELLDLLESKGMLLAVLTNKPQVLAEQCMRDFLPKWSFALVQGQVPGRPVKPDPASPRLLMERLGLAVEEILYLGDTDVDMRTATSVGMHPVGVLWGFRPEEELRRAGARTIISHPLELRELLD